MPARGVSNRALLSLLALASLVVARPAAAAGGANPGHFPNQVGPGVYRLDGTDNDLPLDDLAPLSRIVGNARFVGVGESFHTTGGIYQLKGRVLRYLVEEQGFRVLAWESPYFWATEIERFLGRCDQPAADFLAENAVLFNVFRSSETADVLQWMCDWNESHPRPQDQLHIYGFDVQRTPREAADGLISFLTVTGLDADDPLITGIQACDGVVETFYPSRPFPAERYQQCQDTLTAVAAYFDANEGALERASSRQALGWARVYRTIEQAWQGQAWSLAAGDFYAAFNFRDPAMAYLAEAIHDLAFPHERVMLWAHNGHVSRDGVEYVGLPTMGDFLHQSLGSQYRVLGIAASETYVNWLVGGACGLVDLTVPGVPQSEAAFAGVGEGALLVDLDPRGAHPGLLAPDTVYAFGGGALVPAAGFDGILYLPVSPAMHPLPGLPSCP